ncbi:hypothetical protein SELMODRAFT_431021 [Selaginella moellendorffii]|uniref:Pentacotripeptide-repeat region of PRORP domain-containing protein n=1 Tax=Selaginella moellendorffii TaxID=88036 RepID=D8TB98_SELML|nr:hypothetical protein SELMODRAFT_431021 [Selaginella moellendorffii]
MASDGRALLRVLGRIFRPPAVLSRGIGKIARMPDLAVKPQDYDVDAWSDAPYLEFIVGLEQQGSTPATSTGGSTLAGVRGNKRPYPGRAAQIVRIQIENGKDIQTVLAKHKNVRDFGAFWMPLVRDLMAGPVHHHTLEIFTWMKLTNQAVLKSATVMELDRLYAMMISYAGVVGHTILARRWFGNVMIEGKKSSECCNALIIAYAKARDLDSAMQIFHGMKEFSRECPPNAMTCHILTAMFAHYHNWQGLEVMVRECRDAGVLPDAITFNTLLHAYAKMGRRDRFESTYQEMEQVCRGFKRSSETFAALLIGYARLDALDRFHQVLGEMRAENSQLPHNIAVPAVEEAAKAHSRTATVEGIEKLIEFVETTPEIASTWAFQSYVVEVGMVERIYALYIKCREVGLRLSSRCYKSLLAEMARAGHSIDIASFDEHEERSKRVLRLLPRMEVSTKKIFGFTARLLKAEPLGILTSTVNPPVESSRLPYNLRRFRVRCQIYKQVLEKASEWRVHGNLQREFIHLFGSLSPQKRYARELQAHVLVDHVACAKHRWSKIDRRQFIFVFVVEKDGSKTPFLEFSPVTCNNSHPEECTAAKGVNPITQ